MTKRFRRTLLPGVAHAAGPTIATRIGTYTPNNGILIYFEHGFRAELRAGSWILTS